MKGTDDAIVNCRSYRVESGDTFSFVYQMKKRYFLLYLFFTIFIVFEVKGQASLKDTTICHYPLKWYYDTINYRANDCYRFKYSSYNNDLLNKLSIRFEKNNDTIYNLIIQYLSFKPRFFSRIIRYEEPVKKAFIEDTLIIAQDKWLAFQTLTNKLKFWDTPIIEKTNIVVMDGSTWIFEGKVNEKYHMVSRHVDKVDIEELCFFLVKLSEDKTIMRKFNVH
jgi:hypothetical protein